MISKNEIQEIEIIEDVKEVAKPVVIKEQNRKGVYVVKGEDTLYAISKKHGISIEEIKRLNNLEDNTIHEGDQLRLEKNIKRKKYHIVEKKETLYGISKQYNITLQELKWLNGLENSNLFIGQELRIEK